MLKFDIVYNHGVTADTILSTAAFSKVKKNELGVSLGFEYSINNEQRISASVAGRYFLNQSGDLTTGERLINKDIVDRWRLLYTHQFLNNDLTYSFLTIGSIDDESLLASMALDYALDDNWSVMTQAISTWASKTSSSIILDEGLRFGLNTKYSF